MNKLYIAFLTLLIHSCNPQKEHEKKLSELILKEPKQISDFNLKDDFIELTKKITQLDTIEIWANLSSCQWVCEEKIILTKNNDSLVIELNIKQMTDPEITEIIKVNENDTVWNFNKFLTNNKERILKTEERNKTVLLIRHRSEIIEFHAGNLSDLNSFIRDYYETMRKLEQKNKTYKYIMEADNSIK